MRHDRPRPAWTTPKAGRSLSIAYVTDTGVVVTGGDGRPIAVNAPAAETAEPPGNLSWSPDGRYVAWSTGTPDAVVEVDTASRAVRSFPCPCTEGVYSGDRLLALEDDLSALLILPPGGSAFQRVPVRGPLARTRAGSVRLLGGDASGTIVMTEAGAKQYSFFHLDLTGSSRPVAAAVPRWGAEPARSDARHGAAFVIASNGGACGFPDGIVLAMPSPPSVRRLIAPKTPTRWNIVDFAWGADGHLYVATADWPYCDDPDRTLTEPGEVWERDGDQWRDTGVNLLGYQPISAHSYVGLRGTVTFDEQGGLSVTQDLVVGEAGSAPARVIATKVTEFAVSPRSMSEFAGPAPAPPSPSPSPRVLVLGRSWANDQEGYGTVRPSKIFNGGDPTGLVQDLRWTSWGGAKATATGTALWAPGIVANGKMEPAHVVAFDRGDCRGSYAYRAIEWYFPQHGQAFKPHHHYLNICTGSYVD